MKMCKKVVVIWMVCSVLMLALIGCGKKEEQREAVEAEIQVEESTVAESLEECVEEEPAQETPVAEDMDMFKDTGFSTFELTSEDLHDGVWDSVITNTENGSNVSPQLSWDAVPDAACYVIYMVDTTVEDWIHWKSNNVTETNLPQGWAPEGEYIGPYPPGGTHDYEIYVFALKEPVERAKGAYNNSNMKFKKNCLDLDAVTEGTSGNILAYGHTTGTYTKGD